MASEPKRKRGRPPKKKVTRVEISPKVTRSPLGKVPAPGASDIIGKIQGGESSGLPGGAPRVDPPDPLSSGESPDAIAAAKLREQSEKESAGKPAGASSDKKIEEISKEIEKDLLFAKELLPMLNSRLRESGSVWAATDAELERLSFLTDKMIEKYFPQLDQYALEFCFVSALAAYSIPRYMAWRSEREKARPASSPATVEPPNVSINPIVKDSRLDGL